MFNRHQRRKARLTSRISLGKLKIATLDQHFEDMLQRVRAEFERTGEIHSRFECVTDGKIFHVPANWRDYSEKSAVCAALRDSFRRRRVSRYVFASEVWVGKTPGLRPTDDPNHGEGIQVVAVERNGPRKCSLAEITRDGEKARLGPWKVNGDDVPKGWLLELLEDGYSDRAPRTDPPPLGRISRPDLQSLLAKYPEHRVSFEIHSQLEGLIADQVKRHDNGDPAAMFMALESVLLSLVKDMGSPKCVGEFARFLRDHPDHFPMFSMVPDQVPSRGHVHRCKATLRSFICDKREAGNAAPVIFEAFMNTYMHLGSQAIGALNLADRIENWNPEHQAKLRRLGLRSSFELDDEEGLVFVALSADRYPTGVMGRRNAVGDLYVSRIVSCPFSDFFTAVERIKQGGFEVILGPEAKQLLCKMEQVKGVASRTDNKQGWDVVEEWGQKEWTEQVLAEIVFAKAINVQHDPTRHTLYGNVAGYQVRRAPNGLVLVSSDSDDDVFVGVKVEKEKGRACILGWIRGSEGKLQHFYQNGCWVIPAGALHIMEELPGKERLGEMPPFQENFGANRTETNRG